MKYFFALVLIISYLNSFGQIESNQIRIIDKLKSLNYAESENGGYEGGPGKSRMQFDSIKSKLDNNQLVEFAKNSSSSLRLYSAIELIHRNDNRIIDIYKTYKNNDYELSYDVCCTVENRRKISTLIFSEFGNLIKKEQQVKLIEEQLSRGELQGVYLKNDEDFVKYGNEYLKKIITPKFYRIYKRIQKLN